MRTRKWIAVCEGPAGNVCEWSDGMGTFGACLEVKNTDLMDKAMELMGKIVVFSTVASKTWEGHDVLINLWEAKEEDFERYQSSLDEEVQASRQPL